MVTSPSGVVPAVPPGDAEPAKIEKAGCMGCALVETKPENGALALAGTAIAMFALRRRRAS